MTTFANSGNVQPAQGGEVACCSIAGGPFAAIDAYVSGGTPGVQLEFRLYATVGTLRTRVATAPYAGPPVGAAGQGTLLKWTVIGQPQATSPVIAGGTAYDLVVYGVNGAGSGVLTTLAGTNAYDTSVASSATVALPSNYGSMSIATNVGCAQLADVGVDQASLPSNVTFDVLASCGAGSVEALVGTGGSGGSDGKSSVIRDLPLPVATQYRLAVRETQGKPLSGNVTAALATYFAIIPGTGSVALAGEVTGPSNANVVTGPFSQASLKWKNTVLAAVLGTNVANATLSLAFDLNVNAVTYDPVNGLDTFFDVGAVKRVQFDLSHGYVIAGGGGTEFTAHIGPMPGPFLSSNIAIWALGPGGVRTASNMFAFSDGQYLSLVSPGGTLIQFGTSSVSWARITSTILELFQVAIQYDAITAPALQANSVRVYTDAADNALKAIGASGDITILAPA